jgi:hypothetical protein
MATRMAFADRAGALWTSPALADGLLAYAVAMAVGVAVFASSVGSQPGPWPAYLFAIGFGLILLIRRSHPVLVLIITLLGICVYYALEYPPIGLALPIAAALFSAAEAGHLRVSIVLSVILVGLTVYFQIAEGRDVAQLLGYELPPVIALMGASLALGDGVRTRRLLKESQRERERHARMELERRATEQRNEERLRLARDLHDALGHNVAMISLQSAVAAEALPERVPEAQRAVAEIRSISLAAMADLRSTAAASEHGIGCRAAGWPQRAPRARRAGPQQRPQRADRRDRGRPGGAGRARSGGLPNCSRSVDQRHPARERNDGSGHSRSGSGRSNRDCAG